MFHNLLHYPNHTGNTAFIKVGIAPERHIRRYRHNQTNPSPPLESRVPGSTVRNLTETPGALRAKAVST